MSGVCETAVCSPPPRVPWSRGRVLPRVLPGPPRTTATARLSYTRLRRTLCGASLRRGRAMWCVGTMAPRASNRPTGRLPSHPACLLAFLSFIQREIFRNCAVRTYAHYLPSSAKMVDVFFLSRRLLRPGENRSLHALISSLCPPSFLSLFLSRSLLFARTPYISAPREKAGNQSQLAASRQELRQRDGRHRQQRRVHVRETPPPSTTGLESRSHARARAREA